MCLKLMTIHQSCGCTSNLRYHPCHMAKKNNTFCKVTAIPDHLGPKLLNDKKIHANKKKIDKICKSCLLELKRSTFELGEQVKAVRRVNDEPIGGSLASTPANEKVEWVFRARDWAAKALPAPKIERPRTGGLRLCAPFASQEVEGKVEIERTDEKIEIVDGKTIIVRVAERMEKRKADEERWESVLRSRCRYSCRGEKTKKEVPVRGKW